MGAKQSFEANLWQSKFEFDSKNSRVGMIKLSDRQTEDTYICRKICTVDKNEIFEIDRLIDLKLSIQSPYIVKLQKAQSQDNREYCSYGKNYYLLFKQPYQTLKQQTLNRKFKNSMYSESQLQMMLEVGVKALSFLKNIYHPHSNISSTSFFINQNRSMILGDPFMFPKENSAVIIRNGFIYPSPQMIRFQNGEIQSYNEHLSDLFTLGLVLLQVFFMVNMDCVYERYFQRVDHQAIWSKLKSIRSQDLKKKLFILLDPEPKNRQMIFKMYIKSIPSQELYRQMSKQHFKKNIQRYNLATSQVTQWKNQFHFEQRVSSSEGKNTISVSTADHLHNDEKAYNYYERQYGKHLNPVQNNFNVQQNYQNNNYGQSNHKFSRLNESSLINRNIQYLNTPINIERRVVSTSENIQNSQIRFNMPLQVQKPLIYWNTNNYKYQPSSYRSVIGTPYNTQPVSTNYPNIATNSLRNQEFSKNYAFGLPNYTFGNSNYTLGLPNNASGISSTLQGSQKQYANDIKSNQAIEAQIKGDIDFKIRNNYFQSPHFTEGNDSFANNKSDQIQTEQKNMNEPIKLISQSIKIQEHNQPKQIVIKPQIINFPVKQHSQTPSKSRKRRISDYGKLHHLSTINQKSEMTDSFVSGQDDSRSQILIQEDVDANFLSKSNCKNFKSSLEDHSETDQNRMWSIVYPSGTKYMGQMKNDKRNGVGTFFYIDGSKYHGDWLDNKMNGFGTLCYPNGKIAYEGEWKMDNFHGKGKVYNDEIIQFQGTYHYENCEDIDQFWQDYQGQLFDDKRQGRGVLKLSNKQYFDGRFRDDQLHGLCKFHRLDGQIIEGIWQNNKLVKVMSQKQ